MTSECIKHNLPGCVQCAVAQEVREIAHEASEPMQLEELRSRLFFVFGAAWMHFGQSAERAGNEQAIKDRKLSAECHALMPYLAAVLELLRGQPALYETYAPALVAERAPYPRDLVSLVDLLRDFYALTTEKERAAPVLRAALVVGHWWRAQDGIGALELEDLADAVAVYNGEPDAEEPDQ